MSAVAIVRIIAWENAGLVAAAGAIPLLVQLLNSSSVYVQEEAAHAIGSLSFAGAVNINAQIIHAGAIPLLVGLLRTPETQEKAALALRTIAEEFRTHAEILAASPILPLVRLLASDSEGAQAEHATEALLQLSNAPTFPKQFVAAGAIPSLVHLLRSESDSVQRRAVAVLVALAAKGRSDIFAPVKSAGALPLLAHLQTAASSREMQYAAEKLLQILRTGASSFDDLKIRSPSAPMSSTAASACPATAAGSSSTDAVASPPSAAASPQHRASAAGSPSTADTGSPSEADSPEQPPRQQLPPRPRKSCRSCGATGVPLKKCSVCAVAAYCGAVCQKADWKAHKGQCPGLKAGSTGIGGLSAAGEK